VSVDASVHHHTHAAPEPVTGPVRFRLPRVVAHFTGRDTELGRLDQALGERHQAVITQTVIGLGGVGKTQLAAAYVHRHVDEYEVVAWIRAEDGGIGDLAALASELDLSVEGLTPEEQGGRVVRWLESADRSWLLVLDNVAHPAQLATLCPSSGPGRVLVTSRRRDFDEFGPVVDVGVFDEPTAVRYLVGRTGRTGERVAAGELARALGGLPLALSHAAAYCTTRTSFDGYLGLLAELPAAELYDRNREAYYDRTVATTWKVSVDAADREAPLAGAALAMAAHLAPDAIPRSLFFTLASSESARDRGRVDAALEALHRYSLAEVTDASVSVHRLLQKVVRDDAQSRGDTISGQAALMALADAFPDRYDTGLPVFWPTCETLMPHVVSLREATVSWTEIAEGLMALLNRTTRYLLHAGADQRAIVIIQAALASTALSLGADHPETMVARGDLGYCLGAFGQLDEAIVQFQTLLSDQLRVLGPDHADTLATRGNLAYWMGKVGRVDEATTQFRTVLDDRLRVLGLDHPGTLTTRANLGYSLGTAGRVTEAVARLEALVQDCLRVLGPDHPRTLTTRADLARWLGELGRVDEAVARLEVLADDRLRVLGPDHPDTLTTRGYLAYWLGKAGRIDEAIVRFQVLLDDRIRVVGPDHPRTLSTRGDLACWLGEAGRVDEAVLILHALLEADLRTLGPRHPDTLTTRGALAHWLGEEGRVDEAISRLEALLEDHLRILGPQHPHTLATRRSLDQWLSRRTELDSERSDEH
jgi:tetratricopeptide (TPR) repeat protein